MLVLLSGHILQLQGQGALQALRRRGGVHRRGRAGDLPHVEAVGGVPAEAHHLVGPAVHRHRTAQGGGQAVEQDVPGEAELILAQLDGAARLLQRGGLQPRFQYLVHKGLSRRLGLGGVAAGVPGKAGFGALLLVQAVPDDGAVLQGVHGQAALRPLPGQRPLADKPLVIALPIEIVIGRGVQLQDVLHRLGHLGQALVLGELRRSGGQSQAGGQSRRQAERYHAFHL